MSQNNALVAAARRNRLWIPLAIIILAILASMRARGNADLDTMSKGFRSMLIVALSFVLFVVWWLFLSRLSWRVRLTGLGLVALCVTGLTLLFRIDGSYDGSGSMRIVWSWTPKRSGKVVGFKAPEARNAATKVFASSEYRGYLGNDRSGVLPDIHLETDWTNHPPKELWRRPIGLGWSGFAVVGSQAVTQEQRGENELVVAYELATGRQRWSHTNCVRFSEPMGGDGPRATPTIDRGRVYALGATGILDCLDAATGKRIWSHNVLEENGLPNTYFGKSSSPLVVDELVVVTGGLAKKSTLLAFHRDDGSPAWQAGKDEAGFSSPTLVTLDGTSQILSVNASSVTGHDPKDGRILWDYPWPGSMPKCAQPVVVDGSHVFLSASFNAGCMLLQVNKGKNGRFAATEVWRNYRLKSEFSNIVSHDGFLYGLDDGILVCVDVATGARRWKDGRYGHGQVLLVGDRLLVQTEPGPTALVDASPSGFHELAKFKTLNAKTWNTPALAGEFLLVRNDQEAACYRLPMASPPGR